MLTGGQLSSLAILTPLILAVYMDLANKHQSSLRVTRLLLSYNRDITPSLELVYTLGQKYNQIDQLCVYIKQQRYGLDRANVASGLLREGYTNFKVGCSNAV